MVHLRQCIVIGIEEGSERFSRIQLFSKEEGFQQALKRKSTYRTGLQHLDLFQTVELVLEQKPTHDIGFLKETHILAERANIGKTYAAFESASRFCRAIYLNARHVEAPESVYDLLQQCLDAWNSKPHPQTTFFKALFRLAMEEGFPVRQIWLHQMPAKEKALAYTILTQPLESLTSPETPSKVLAENLTNWLTHQQDFLF